MKTALLCVLFCFPFAAAAAGVTVGSEKITIAAWDWLPARGKFTVQNPNQEHVTVEFWAEGQGSGWLTLSEKRVVLGPGEARKIGIRVSARRGGNFSPTVLIQEQALEGPDLGVATGVRLPVEIRSRALLGPLAAAAITVFAIWFLRKKLKPQTKH